MAGNNRVALITGASGGLGSVVTAQFLEAGYRVSAVALDWESPAPPSESLIATRADLTVRSAAQSVVQQTIETWGTVDFLVHLVGAFDAGQRVEETSDAQWDRMLGVNLRSAVNMLRAVIPAMRQKREGRIMVVGATSAIHPVAAWSAFSASVAALCSLVETSAAELREEGITVNAILPTTIDTPAVRAACGEADRAKWVNPNSLASLMLWLCSDAGRDVTGALIPVIGRQPHPCHQWH